MMDEFQQLAAVQIGYGPIGHAGLGPTDQMVSLMSQRPCLHRGDRRPEKDIDDMFSPFVHQSGNRPTVHVIESTSDQRKPLFGQISNRWGEIELAGEPRLDHMSVGRRDVYQMADHQ